MRLTDNIHAGVGIKQIITEVSQRSSSTAANKNPKNWNQRSDSWAPSRQPAANSTGITATEYIRHLMAAFQRRRRSDME